MIAFFPLVMLLSMSPPEGSSPPAKGNPDDADLTMDNGLVKVSIQKNEDGYRESYYAKDSTGWHLVLVSGSPIRSDPALKVNGALERGLVKSAALRPDGMDTTRVELKGSNRAGSFVKSIVLLKNSRCVAVNVSYDVTSKTQCEYLLSTYSFVPDGKQYQQYKPLDFVFTPTLRPEPDEVIADHAFRSPALMMQKGSVFAALLPDLRTIDGKQRVMKSSADVQVESAESPFMSFGLMNWTRRKEHVYYSHADSMTVSLSDTTVSYGYFLCIRSDAAPRRGYQDVVRFHWAEYGQKNFAHPQGPQSEPFSSYIHKAWYEYLPQVALDTVYNGKHVTLLRQARLAWSNKLHAAADNDCWFNVWFNSLRTAYGMYLHGRSTGDMKLMDQAERVLTLALEAPQNKGIAPSIFYIDSAGGHWVGDQAWGGISHGEYLSMFHNAWTCSWLLEWADLLPERAPEIIRYTKAFADFLLAQQQPTGVIPSWYDSLTLEASETFRDENAETAGAALFLAGLYARTHEHKYLVGAEKAMDYIFAHILPENRWFDYETFFSCSRKPLGFFDSYTHQHPQNTLSMQMAAEACCELYHLTKQSRYKETGIAIMDYLCLYQQIWSPKWLSCALFGGFGVQNTDGEWSDSRQGYFAVTLLKYFELSGNREYFERGVAALRAMFSLFESPTSPRTAENYAHGSFDQIAVVTGLHWGTGSSAVSIHIIRQRYGDAFINVRNTWGIGIDGCRIPDVTVHKNTVRFELLDNVASTRTVKVVFAELVFPVYDIIINGKALGKFSSEELQKGIEVGI